MAQIIHTSIVAFACLAGLTTLLLALPNMRLGEAVYRFGEWITYRKNDQL